MKKVHYFAAFAEADSKYLLGCEHEHQTVASAVACINVAAGYVVAVETCFRALNEQEEEEFQHAMYGIQSGRKGEGPPDTPLEWVPAK